MGQFLQPDFSRGDPNTLGGYMAVHDRPAAFEGSDGFSYSVDILTDEEQDAAGAERWTGFLLFVKWTRIGASAPEGHLDSAVLVRGATEDDVRAHLGAMTLSDVRQVLESLIRERHGGAPRRRWWDAMRDDDPDADAG